jgi:hypothetical protein
VIALSATGQLAVAATGQIQLTVVNLACRGTPSNPWKLISMITASYEGCE